MTEPTQPTQPTKPARPGRSGGLEASMRRAGATQERREQLRGPAAIATGQSPTGPIQAGDRVIVIRSIHTPAMNLQAGTVHDNGGSRTSNESLAAIDLDNGQRVFVAKSQLMHELDGQPDYSRAGDRDDQAALYEDVEHDLSPGRRVDTDAGAGTIDAITAAAITVRLDDTTSVTGQATGTVAFARGSIGYRHIAPRHARDNLVATDYRPGERLRYRLPGGVGRVNAVCRGTGEDGKIRIHLDPDDNPHAPDPLPPAGAALEVWPRELSRPPEYEPESRPYAVTARSWQRALAATNIYTADLEDRIAPDRHWRWKDHVFDVAHTLDAGLPIWARSATGGDPQRLEPDWTAPPETRMSDSSIRHDGQIYSHSSPSWFEAGGRRVEDEGLIATLNHLNDTLPPFGEPTATSEPTSPPVADASTSKDAGVASQTEPAAAGSHSPARSTPMAPDTPDELASPPAAAPVDVAATVEHSAEGTLVHGTSRDDKATIQALKDNGFRWSRNLESWYLPRNLTHDTRDRKVAGLQAALGERVAVEIPDDGRRLTAAEKESATRERAADRADRMGHRAEKLQSKAEAMQADTDRFFSSIPLGQPDIVDTSAGRTFARQRQRMHDKDRRAHETAQAAEHAEAAAQRAQQAANGTDSVVTITNRIERNEALVRKVDRGLAGHQQAQGIIDKVGAEHPKVAAVGEHRLGVRSPERLAQLEQVKAEAVDAIAHDRAKLEASGGVKYGKHNVEPGDIIVSRSSGWVPVLRSNAKTATVPSGYSWTDTIPWPKVTKVVKAEKFTPDQIRGILAEVDPSDKHRAAAFKKTLARAEAVAQPAETAPAPEAGKAIGLRLGVDESITKHATEHATVGEMPVVPDASSSKAQAGSTTQWSREEASLLEGFDVDATARQRLSGSQSRHTTSITPPPTPGPAR